MDTPESHGFLTESQRSLTNLLLYAGELLQISERVTTELSRDAIAHFHGGAMAVLPGIATNLPDDLWIRIERLAETAPPAPDEAFLPWLAATPALERPALAAQLMVCLPVEAISDLIEAGLADTADVLRPRGVAARWPDAMDVLLRLDRLPEFAAAFTAWVDGPWSDWLRAEQPRRASIACYNALFATQQRMTAMGDDAAVECILGVGIARWSTGPGRFDLPLIEAAVEFDLDPQDGALLIRPRPAPPRMALRAFEEAGIIAGGTLPRDAAARLQAGFDDPDTGFSPFALGSFDPVLRLCHARLSATATYLPDAAPAPADSTLRITGGWVLLVRARSADFRCDDIRRLAVQVAEASSGLPAPAVQLTVAPTDKPIANDFGDLLDTTLRRGEPPPAHDRPDPGRPDAGVDGRAFLFPLPFNDEQIEIVRRLDDPAVHGVVVQGPPGTGKTHTIANIICHYMATGRRILVTARTAEALSAIQHKLPPEVRDLAIAVIHSDREGGKQLERAIDILATQVKQIDGRAYAEQRLRLEDQLAEVRDGLAAVDAGIRAHAVLNLAQYEYGGAPLTPMELVAAVEAGRGAHGWFEDRPAAGPNFTATDIDAARAIRARLGADILYPASALPLPDALPDAAQVLAAHAALARRQAMDARTASGELPLMARGSGVSASDTADLRAGLEAFTTWLAELRADGWLLTLFQVALDHRPAEPSVRDRLRLLCDEWATLHRDGQGFALSGLEFGGAPVPDPAFDAAVDALARGGKPFGVFSFGKSALKAQLDAVRLEGRAPAGAEAWAIVRDGRRWQKAADGFLGRWTAAARVASLPPLPAAWESGSRELLRLGALMERMAVFRRDAPRRIAQVAALFPHGVDARRVVLEGDTAAVLEALAADAARGAQADSKAVLEQIDAAMAAGALPFQTALRDVRDALGSPAAARELAEAWASLAEEARRLDALRADRLRLDTIAAAVAVSSAPVWAKRLAHEPVDGPDAWTPAHWAESWAWAQASAHVERLTGRNALAALTERHTALEARQTALLGELVAVRTFIGLKRSITERIASALTKFAMTVRRLGAGTGKAAERHRRAIREAVLEAADAVPCWILPEWRVAEQLPATLGTFDLVIVDEASQSDITALPAVLRGRKLLVVGDDRQVSPSAVGMEERTVIQLRQTYLRGTALANVLEPTTSLYDLASMMFPGSTIMLREHFRCVEPIIRFSSRFYPKALVPLRLPTAAERLDPPLIDILVPHGRKIRDVNEAEADVIVAEVAALAADPAYAARSIGVISLIGDKQARRIYEKLTDTIGTAAMARHRVMCGNAATFQGQERDIMFLSMVACPDTVRAQTARMMEQRFNVAMSRARDRMVLVRSVTPAMLSPRDLKLAVIEHFRNPMGDAAIPQPEDILELCDSGFERDVGRRLLALGYRVVPQVPVGGFRIDFVVEGEGDRRLAVELDGDRYHGPDRWADDLRRQRALERIGWVFWRCWGSHWLADPAGCLDDLLAALSRRGIAPVGGNPASHAFTEHRVAGPAADVVPLPPGRGEASVVQAGDSVIVRHADDNRVRLFRLSKDADDGSGAVPVGQPIALALLGSGVEEEVELPMDGQPRMVIIEKIIRAA